MNAQDLRPYPAYRDSGVEWLGEIPAHWDVGRFKRLLDEREERSTSGSEPLLRVSQYTGVTERGSLPGQGTADTRASSLIGYRVVQPDDLAVNIMLAWNGSLGVSRSFGIVSPAYCVYRFKEALHPWYCHYLLRSETYKTRIKSASTGVVDSRLRLYSDQLYALECLVPSRSEQAAIACFLNDADRRIRRAIRAKEKLIALLGEQKQALIHDAVTGRIDVRTGQPYPAYKDSGVDSLGRIPAHWLMLPLKRWVSTRITDGPHETPTFVENGVPFMSAESMIGGRLDFTRKRGFITPQQHEIYCRKCRPQLGDIFMCKSGATTGKVSIVDTTVDFSIWSPLALIRVDPHRVYSELLMSVLQADYVQQQVRDTWSYGTQPNLSMGAIERLAIALPTQEEQRSILDYLTSKLSRLSVAAKALAGGVDLLREYRTSLIADVITGKLDVREATALLPEDDAPTASEEGRAGL